MTSTAYPNLSIYILLLLQSALQPLWVLACSIIVDYSQQEVFYRVPLPDARQTPQLGGPVIRTFQLPPPGVPTSETTRANCSNRWKYGREITEDFAESGDFHVTFGFFTYRKFTTWDRRLYFPSEGRRAKDFFVRKIRRIRPGLNPRTWVPEVSTLTCRPPKPLPQSIA